MNGYHVRQRRSLCARRAATRWSYYVHNYSASLQLMCWTHRKTKYARTLSSAGLVANLSRFTPLASNTLITRSAVATANLVPLGATARATARVCWADDDNVATPEESAPAMLTSRTREKYDDMDDVPCGRYPRLCP